MDIDVDEKDIDRYRELDIDSETQLRQIDRLDQIGQVQVRLDWI